MPLLARRTERDCLWRHELLTRFDDEDLRQDAPIFFLLSYILKNHFWVLFAYIAEP